MADLADLAQAQEELMDKLRKEHPVVRRPIPRASEYCVDCGEKIESLRLHAVPHAVRCAYCQSEQERMNRLYGSNNQQ